MPQIQKKIKSININILEIISIVLFLSAFLLRNMIRLNIYSAWIQIIPMGFLLIAFRSGKGKISTILNSKPLQFLGNISFELYMTHAFIYEGLPVMAGFVSTSIRKWLIVHAGTRFVITFILCIIFAWIVHQFMKLLNKKLIARL